MSLQHVTRTACTVALAGLCVACGSDTQPAPPGAAPQPAPPPAAAPQAPAGQAAAQPPAQPAPAAAPGTAPAPAQNPVSTVMGALGAAQGQPGAAGTGVAAIPWQSLVQALPVTTPGWTLDGQPEGESASMGGFTSSVATCTMKQGAMSARVEIMDTSLNPMLSMPFNMARAMRVDSSDERMGPINFGAYPGTQVFRKKSNVAEVMVMVNNRVLIKVTVSNATAEAPAVGVMQYVNFAHLAQLVGG